MGVQIPQLKRSTSGGTCANRQLTVQAKNRDVRCGMRMNVYPITKVCVAAAMRPVATITVGTYDYRDY